MSGFIGFNNIINALERKRNATDFGVIFWNVLAHLWSLDVISDSSFTIIIGSVLWAPVTGVERGFKIQNYKNSNHKSHTCKWEESQYFFTFSIID